MPTLDRQKLDRTTLGTFKPKYGETMEKIGVRVPKSVAEKLKKMPDMSGFLRAVIISAVEDSDNE